MNRTALRLALVTLLSNNFTKPFPTLAEDRVFDSSQLPPQQGNGEMRPEIVIYTDDDEGDSLDDQSGDRLVRRVDVVIMCYFPIWGAAIDDQGCPLIDPATGAPIMAFDLPETDAEMESTIDMMETQVRFALNNPVSPWWQFLRGAKGLMPKINSWHSGRYAEAAKSRVRFAYRIIKLQVEMPDDPLPGVRFDDSQAVNTVQMKVPDNITALLDRIKKDPAPDGAPRGYVAPLVNILEHYGTPHLVTAQMLKSVRLRSRTNDMMINTEEPQ